MSRFARVLGAVALLASSAAAASDVSPTPYPEGWPHRAPWKLNRELLWPGTKRIVFVVDAPRGAAPQPAALDHLVYVAFNYSDRPVKWVKLGDAGSPAVRWQVPAPPAKPQIVYVRLRGGTPIEDAKPSGNDLDTIRVLGEVPACLEGPLPEDVSFIFVRYVGTLWDAYGDSATVVSDSSCGGREFPIIRMAQATIARNKVPGIGQDFLEERAIVHEYGHVLGLDSNPAHGWWMDTRAYRTGAHCTHSECALAVPSAKALLKGQMLDFCDACRRDIETAREYWRTGKEFPESPRLPQRDPAAEVASLKNYNFRDGGEAEKLVRYGKRVMPALMARLATLPGKDGASPRGFGARLALLIVRNEDLLRRPAGGPGLAVPVTAAELSGPVLAWWGQESKAFMEGDAWAPPEVGESRKP